jgi:hypothetical protein
LREEHRLSEFENRWLGRYMSLIGVEVTGEWRRLHNDELYNLFSLQKLFM